MDTKLKRCIKCGEYKPLDQFSKDKNGPDGLKRYCKDCVRLQTAEYREKHLTEILSRRREFWKCQEATNLTVKADAAGERTCPCCGKLKPVTEFYRRSNGNLYARCKECERAAQKRFREEHPEHVREQSRQYNRSKKLGVAKPDPEPPIETKEEMRKRLLSRRASSPERKQEIKRLCSHRRRARKRALPSTLTVEEWEACKEFFDHECAYCGAEVDLTQEHVVPVTKGGGYTKENIIPACLCCNQHKLNRDIWDWYCISPNYSVVREMRIRSYLFSMSTP